MLDNPAVEAVVVNLRDITEYRRIEQELRKSEERYRYLVENLYDVVFTVDTQGTVLYISPAIERMSKYSPQDLEGHPFMHFIHPEDLPGLLQELPEDPGRHPRTLRVRAIDKDRCLPVQTSSRPSRRMANWSVDRDMPEITERKQADEARRRSEESSGP